MIFNDVFRYIWSGKFRHRFILKPKFYMCNRAYLFQSSFKTTILVFSNALLWTLSTCSILTIATLVANFYLLQSAILLIWMCQHVYAHFQAFPVDNLSTRRTLDLTFAQSFKIFPNQAWSPSISPYRISLPREVL